MPNSDEKRIRFIDSAYNNLFSIPDGGNVVITREDGEVVTRPCHYVDDYHFESAGHTWHICEFAERMEQNNARYFPKQGESKWPAYCYSVIKSTGDLIDIHAGESGYYPHNGSTFDKGKNRELAGRFNTRLGISRGMEEAMHSGSMFGWDVPLAQPENYNADGTLNLPIEVEPETEEMLDDEEDLEL